MIRQPDRDTFLRDVARHKMEVLHNDGLYRHLRFSQPDNSNLWFEIVTWPDILTIHGDMGTWTFSRIDDMFRFFRNRRALDINADYWGEKLCLGVHGGSSAAKRFDGDDFLKQLIEQLDGYGLEADDLEAVTEAIREEIVVDEGRDCALRTAAEFRHVSGEPEHSDLCRRTKRYGEGCICGAKRREFEFDSCELPDGEVYSYHFLWCLYAIVWGIQQWDKYVLEMGSAVTPRDLPSPVGS